MDRAYASGAAGSAPSAPTSPSIGYPTAGNPGSGTPATKPGPWWYHMTTEELRALVVAAGITPDHTALDQVLRAVRTVAPSVVGSFRNLLGSSAGAVKTASWTVSEIVAKSALGGIGYVGAALSLAFNGATTGANGMDTGGTPAGTDLYIYTIYNPTTNTWATLGTIAGSGAAVYGGANMPAGYTASCLIWSGKTTGSGQFTVFKQYDRMIAGVDTGIISTTSNIGTFTSLSIAAAVPVNAKSINGTLLTSGGTPTSTISLASDSSGTQLIYFANSGSPSGNVPFTNLILSSPQTIFYKTGNGGGTSTYGASISSYTI